MKNCFALMVAVGLSLFVATVAHADLFMSVSGKVIAADDGAGLGGIKILLMSPDKGKIAEVKSNPQGTFIIRDVAKGEYDLLAVSEGPFVVSSKTPIHVTVPDGKNVVGVAIKMLKGGTISGKVVTSSGIAVSQATILGDCGLSASTDSSGYFQLQGVAPGSVTLAVSAPAIAAKAVSVVSEAGNMTNIGNIILPIGIESAIRGVVVDLMGNAVPGAIIAASSEKATGGYVISSDSGSFVITGLTTTSTYKLTVVAYGYEPFTLTGIPVPSSGMKVTLTPSAVKAAGMTKYRLPSDKSAVEAMYSAIIPASTGGTCALGNCPEGEWYGLSMDVTASLNVPGVSLSGGSSISIGTHIMKAHQMEPFFQLQSHRTMSASRWMRQGM